MSRSIFTSVVWALSLSLIIFLAGCGVSSTTSDSGTSTKSQRNVSTPQTSLVQLYVATFGRAPDTAGMVYWEEEINSGRMTLAQIAKSFFVQPEAQAWYPPSQATSDFIDAIYQNVLNRASDADGKAYWTTQLNSGTVDKATFVLAIISGALHNISPQGLIDTQLLNNKTEAGLWFATQSNSNDVTLATQVIAVITSDPASVATARALVSTSVSASTAKVYAGYYHSMALKADGTVWAWGDNSDGQLGNGTTIAHTTPVQVSYLSNITEIACGDNNPVALKSDGTVWIWGRDWLHWNALTYTAPIMSTPTQLTGISQVSAIASGHSHGVALKNDGTVWWWGYQALNNGAHIVASTPTLVNGLSGITAITADYALKPDGSVWALNLGGTPAQLAGISSVASLAQYGATYGNANQYAVKTDGSIWSLKNIPAQVTTISSLLAVAEDGPGFASLAYPTIALKSDNTIWAWNQNGNATQVAGISGAIAISNAGSHVLVIKSDGTVWAWGSNYNGMLGNGTTIDSATPVQVIGLNLN